jgi:hypothetical protein
MNIEGYWTTYKSFKKYYEKKIQTVSWKCRVMVFSATFNNISVLLVEEIRVPKEYHWPVASHWQTWSHNVVSHTLAMSEIWTQL